METKGKGAAATQQQHKMGKVYQVIVYGPRGERLKVELCNTQEQFKSVTVLQLNDKIKPRLPGYAGKCPDCSKSH